MIDERRVNHQLRRALGDFTPHAGPAPNLVSLLAVSAANSESMESFYRRLEHLEAPWIEALLQAEDHYLASDLQPLLLLWPLSSAAPVTVPFHELDHKTQFCVLFDEWQRREREAKLAILANHVLEAEETFQECLARARQLGVGELEARAFDGLQQVAMALGDPAAASEWASRARLARGPRLV